MAALTDAVSNAGKLRREIFSILESELLFSPSSPSKSSSSGGRVRILSIDAAGDALLAAACLARLEYLLRHFSGDPAARLSDFFDLAAGSGAGGFLVALLFSTAPPLSTDAALRLLLRLPISPPRQIFRRRSRGIFRRVFGDATLRDAVKPVLIPCYDLRTCAPVAFSRADAVEKEEYDFRMRDVCAATCALRSVEVRSVDGRRRIEGVGGGVAAGNPAAVAVTHVLNNGVEFPLATVMEDLLVLSIDGGVGGTRARRAAKHVQIAGGASADMVDQALAMAFGNCRKSNYVRIQGNGFSPKLKSIKNDPMKLMEAAEEVLSQKNIESVLFRGCRVSEQTNGEKLEQFAAELIKEQERRTRSNIPVIVPKRSSIPSTPQSTAKSISAITPVSISP